MIRTILKSKIHRATVTEADLDYEGSITLPPELLNAADIVDYELVHVWNVTTGARFETYAITGSSSESICINGAAAHRAGPGDIVIIASFCALTESERLVFVPRIVFVDAKNQLREIRKEVPGPENPRS